MKKRLGKSSKRMAAAVMAAVLAFGLTACGDSGSSSVNSGGTPAETGAVQWCP